MHQILTTRRCLPLFGSFLAALSFGLPALAESIVVFNEIHYHPPGTNQALEFIELYNQNAADVDLSRWRLEGGVNFTFPEGTVIRGAETLVVAADPLALATNSACTNALGPWLGNLSNGGERLRLVSHTDRVMEEVEYNDESPWPVGADGSGFTLVKRGPNLASDDASSWTVSDSPGGTPGRVEWALLPPAGTPPPSLLAFYRFDAGPNDASGNGRDGTVSSAGATLTTGGGGYEGEAYRFTGTGFVDLPVDLNPGLVPQATMGAWAKAAAISSPARNEILSTDNFGYDRALTIDTRSGGADTGVARYAAFGGESTGVVPGSLASISDGWVFVAAVFDKPAGRTTLYVGTNAFVGGATHGASAGITRAGAHPSNIEFFNGWIDNVFLFSRALTSDEIAFIRTNGASGVLVLATNMPASTNEATVPPATPLPAFKLAFNEIASATGAVFQIELVNYDTVPLVLSNISITLDGSATNASFLVPDQTLAPGALLAFDEATLGFRPADADRLFLFGAGKQRVLDAVEVKNRAQARVPAGTGAWFIPDALTFGTPNAVTLTPDLVINELMYHPMALYSTNLPVESDEEWVELYNRGESTVNLAGWKLADAIQFTFPSNTFLAPGGYLVVARQAAALRANWPSATILGDFSGRLSNDREHVELRDAQDNTVHEVRYFDGGRWPAEADGGGSSLELRDPRADSSIPEAWAASDETSRSTWQTFTFRGLATNNPGYNIGNDLWQEFVVGLLDSGEVLLDDVSVIDSPAGSRVQLIQNGSFETDAIDQSPAKWRVLGNHSARGRTRVVTDPDSPGNRCLRLAATGPTDAIHNHLETTLKSGASFVSVVVGREYEISFRAKWLQGTPLLNTRLYFNFLERTHVLAVPAHAGTPGAPNSRAAANLGPTFSALHHEPIVPRPTNAVTVSIAASDPDGVAAAFVRYSVNEAAWSSVAMTPLSNGIWAGVIPAQAGGARVQFVVEASDLQGASAAFPPDGTNSRALYVVDNFSSSPTNVHRLRVLTTATEATWLYMDTNRMSNDRLGATVIYDDREVFYDVGLRLKATAYGRTHDSECGFNIAFDPMQPFRGEHQSIAIERGSGNKELLAKQFFNRAGGGVGGLYDDVAYVFTPRLQDTGIGLLALSRHTENFLGTQYANGDDGSIWNFDLLYTPTTLSNPADRESPKFNYPYTHTSGWPDIQDLGEDKETYRWNFMLRNHRDRDDFRAIIAMGKAFDLTGPALDTATRDVLDVSQWLRHFALQSFIGNDDFYTRLWNHNLHIYQRPSDGRLLAFPWDLDRAFQLATSASLWGNLDSAGNPTRMTKVIEWPANTRVYYAHLYDLAMTTCTPDYATRWAQHLGSLAQQDFSGYASYIVQRRSFILSQLTRITNFFNVTTTNLLVSPSNLVTLAGNAGVDVDSIWVNGVPWQAGWSASSTTGPTNFTLRLVAAPGTNVFTIEGHDAAGNILSNTVRTVTVVYQGPMTPIEDAIVINEILFTPTIPDASYIELFNRADVAFDLSGLRFNGLDFTFPSGSIIAPRQYLVLAKSPAALLRQAGTNVPGFIAFDGNLDPDGETLTLLRPGGTDGPDLVIDKVRYENRLPWRTGATNAAVPLQLIDPDQDNSRVSNWADGSGWFFFTLTTNIGASRLSLYFENAGGDVFLDDLKLVSGTVPDLGTNYISNGDFETTLTPPWFLSTLATNSHITNGFARSGSNSLHLAVKPGGASLTTFYQDMPPVVTNTPYTLSFWYHPGSIGSNLTVRAGTSFQARPIVRPWLATPGAANLCASTLPPYDPLWLNELQPESLAGPIDNAGERDPWIELYNAGPDPLDLSGYWLADDYRTNLLQWRFPDGSSIGPGEFKIVWADGEPGETSGTDWHTSFRLHSATGTVALVRQLDGTPQITDYLTYAGLQPGLSYGDAPDGQPFTRVVMFSPTPGATNVTRLVNVFINEWMAANTASLRDPADNAADDWFELHNPGAEAVDLGGYFLTDNLYNRRQFMVPTNGQYVIPARGFLLVWADGEDGQNRSDRPDLHVNFKLSQFSEAIGLFAPDGVTAIDTVGFGLQTNDVSQGHYPDDLGPLHFMHHPTPRSPNQLAEPPAAPEIGGGIVLNGAQVQFTFTTTPGLRYLVEYKEDLSAPAWAPLGPAQPATGTHLIITDNITEQSQRFYRVSVVP
jgi:hypothetical protein